MSNIVSPLFLSNRMPIDQICSINATSLFVHSLTLPRSTWNSVYFLFKIQRDEWINFKRETIDTEERRGKKNVRTEGNFLRGEIQRAESVKFCRLKRNIEEENRLVPRQKGGEERRGEGRILVKEKLEIETVRRGTKRKNGEGRVSKLLVAVIRLKREVKIGAITRGIINL